MADKIDIVSPFCQDCTKECPNHENGCAAWKKYFIENWNEKIYVAPPKREFFQYEHPDLAQEAEEHHE